MSGHLVTRIVSNIIGKLGLNKEKLKENISSWSIKRAYAENGLYDLTERLRNFIPDISCQEESGRDSFNDYYELKRRTLQAFQCYLMLYALKDQIAGDVNVVDIGDSAGTHMLYLRELTKEKFRINTLSVNLDPRAIEKIRKRGLPALLCRAEDLDLGGNRIDLFTSFQMVEHLHNPAIFFRRLAVKSKCDKMLITVPYLKFSRVGLHHIRRDAKEPIFAEDEHIFELSPEDWTLLLKHAGWRVSDSRIYYQYPRRWPFSRKILAWFWRNTDFEGFWGAILEKDTSLSDLYKDWED
jgi:hypothetical protein